MIVIPIEADVYAKQANVNSPINLGIQPTTPKQKVKEIQTAALTAHT